MRPAIPRTMEKEKEENAVRQEEKSSQIISKNIIEPHQSRDGQERLHLI